MKFKYLSLFAFLLATLNVPAINIDPMGDFYGNDLNHELCRQKMDTTLNEHTNGEITVRVARNEDFTCQRLEVSDRNSTLFRDAMIGGYYYLGPDAEHGQPFLAITGPLSKNLVISSWNGGAHCCYSLRIFNINDAFQEIFFLENVNYMPTFIDINQDGIFEIHIRDDFLAYRFSAFAQSATADVILKYNGEKYVIAPEYMLRPPVNLASLNAEISSWRAEIFESGDMERLPYPFMKTLTDLFFSGRRDTALELIDLTWPPGIGTKVKFLEEYKQALMDSKFYTDFIQTLE